MRKRQAWMYPVVVQVVRWIGGVAVAALVCGTLAGPAGAQTYTPDKIAFTGTDLSQTELLAFTGLKPGEPADLKQMQAAADKLTHSGLFNEARYSFDGATLTYALKPSGAVVPVQYSNFPWWDDKTLNAAVAEQVPLFHGGLFPGGPMRDQVSAVLTALLAAKGVQGAVIATSAVGNAVGDQVAILYRIDAPPVVLESFRIYDYSGVWTQPLEEVEKAAIGQKIEGSTRDKLADEVRAVYGRLGFIDMQMTPPQWGQPKVADGKILVPLTASIRSEGGQFRVSGLHLRGDIFMTQEQFEQQAKLKSGDVANQDAWKEIREMVTSPYRTHGYLEAKVETEPSLDRASHTVEYTIAVEPGPVYRMGTLTLANLSPRQKAELLPYWQMKKGDVFNPDLIPQLMVDYRKARAEELQTLRGYGFDARWAVNREAHTVDVTLTFEPPHA